MGRDRISELPDSLLSQILLNLPTKDSVKTSVLSTRWKDLWLNVLGVDLNVNDFPLNGQVFASFMEKFMVHNQEFMEYGNNNSKMHKFKIKYNEFNNYNDRFDDLIRNVVDRGTQHLDVEADMLPSIRDFMPLEIYKSKTLVSLKLVRVGLANPWFVVSLPCLKTMHLENNFVCTDGHFVLENLISGCPVLEDLTLVKSIDRGDDVEVLMSLRVRSQSLKSFRITFANDKGGTDFSVEIDAPRLEYMSFKDNQSDRIVVKNLTSLVMIDIDTEFNVEFGGSPLKPRSFKKRDTICDFLTGVSNVRHMIISRRTLEVLNRYSKLSSIPEFGNLNRLEAEFPSSLLHLLPVFLHSCPNLKNLVLDFIVTGKTKQIDLNVPQCLSLTLESVEIKGLIMEEESGKNLVKYLLENSLALKKLILRFKHSPTISPGSEMSKQLHTFAKCAPNCQVIIY